MVHEAQTSEGESYFLTLTYDDAHLPERGDLKYRDFQLFMKKLRRECGAGVKFVMCGEYGQNGRAHYHACLFHLNLQLDPTRTSDGQVVDSSKTISDLWGLGFVQVAEFTESRALYLSKYLLKSADVPSDIDPETGEVWDRVKPFRHMSLRPGIGSLWYEKYGASDYASDGCVILMSKEAGKSPIGRRVGGNVFYDGRLEKADPLRAAFVKTKRRLSAVELTPTDLENRERYARAMVERSSRPL